MAIGSSLWPSKTRSVRPVLFRMLKRTAVHPNRNVSFSQLLSEKRSLLPRQKQNGLIFGQFSRGKSNFRSCSNLIQFESNYLIKLDCAEAIVRPARSVCRLCTMRSTECSTRRCIICIVNAKECKLEKRVDHSKWLRFDLSDFNLLSPASVAIRFRQPIRFYRTAALCLTN